MNLSGLNNRRELRGLRASLDRNITGPVLYIAYSRYLKKYYVGVTAKSFNERYSKRDYDHHFSNAFYSHPTDFDINIYRMPSIQRAYQLERRLVGWEEAKSSYYYNKIPGGPSHLTKPKPDINPRVTRR